MTGRGTLTEPRARGLGSAAGLLCAWEQGAAVPSGAVGAALLRAAGVVEDLATALDLPLSDSSVLLAAVYARTFGERVQAETSCASCGERLELELPLHRIDPVPEPAAHGTTVVTVPDGADVAGGELLVRCPTLRDVVAAGDAPDPETELLSRCVTDGKGGAVDVAALTPDVRRAVDRAAEQLAGAGALVVRSACPGCGGSVSADVDLAALLWQRVTTEAGRVLGEVAELAAAFGWAESEVLALSEHRRAAYLTLVRGRP